MKLYYSPGACSLAANIALREAERNFELERVDLRTHRTVHGVDYYSINPKGYVPALQLDGPGSLVLTENAAVLQYIGDLVPERGLVPPCGTFAHYHLEEWLSFVGGEIHKRFGPLFHPDTPALTQERLRTMIAKRITYIDGVLQGRAYLMGETFTVADCYLYPLMRWFERFDMDIRVWPTVEAYFKRVSARPTVQAALGAEGLLEHKRLRRTA